MGVKHCIRWMPNERQIPWAIASTWKEKKNTCMHAGEKESKYTYLFQNFWMIDFFSNLQNSGALVANHAYN